ncbi:MAG TPA: rhodanese-like domain-containing protein, partial [Spirochaetales bacterium]|nr:rhodanese-like domain-containing protein [Spirochaetales bacterium]
LDVRTAEEYAVGFIPGAILKPYDAMPGNLDGLPRWAPIVVYCRSGRRSALAAATLKASGYTNVADFGAIDRYTGTLARP